MVEQKRVQRKHIPRRKTEEEQFAVTSPPESNQQPQTDALQQKVAAIVSEVAGERRPHQVLSNEELWRQNVQEVGE